MSALRWLVLAAAIGVGAVGVWRGTWAVGGSDSSCYALMAQAFAAGTLQPTSWLAREAPWPTRQLAAAPGGFVPSPVRDDAASPVCAPGFALLLAPLHAMAGRDAIFVLTPVAGAVLVLLTYVFGRQLAGEWVGVASALVIATTPVLLFQVVQPMNDVTVAAVWAGVAVAALQPRDRSAWVGALTGLALLIRPNLAPAAVVVAAWCLVGGWRRMAWFAVAASPFLGLLAWLNDALYGHPLRSGYGELDALFGWEHIGSNLKNYGTALAATGLGFLLLAVAALPLAPRERRGIVGWVLMLTAAMIAVYLVYRPLPEWWYLRFLLPALPLLTALAMMALSRLAAGRWLVLAATLVVVTYAVSSPAMREAFTLAHLERRFRTAGAVARERLPQEAVILTVWESGSVRYHGGREAVLWEALEPSQLEPALEWLTARGHTPYLMLEDWEEPGFRARFAAHADIGQLDWPPRFDIDRRVRIFVPGDRARFLRGEAVPTEFIRGTSR